MYVEVRFFNYKVVMTFSTLSIYIRSRRNAESVIYAFVDITPDYTPTCAVTSGD
jgi:hypothetical protein